MEYIQIDIGGRLVQVKKDLLSKIPWFVKFFESDWEVTGVVDLHNRNLSAFHYMLDYIQGRPCVYNAEYLEELEFFGVNLDTLLTKKYENILGHDLEFGMSDLGIIAAKVKHLNLENFPKKNMHKIVSVRDHLSGILDFNRKSLLDLSNCGDIINIKGIIIKLPALPEGVVWKRNLSALLLSQVKLQIGGMDTVRLNSNCLEIMAKVNNCERNLLLDVPYTDRKWLSSKQLTLFMPTPQLDQIPLKAFLSEIHQKRLCITTEKLDKLVDGWFEEIEIKEPKLEVLTEERFVLDKSRYSSKEMYEDEFVHYLCDSGSIEVDGYGKVYVNFQNHMQEIYIQVKDEHEVDDLINMKIKVDSTLLASLSGKYMEKKGKGYYYYKFADHEEFFPNTFGTCCIEFKMRYPKKYKINLIYGHSNALRYKDGQAGKKFAL